LKTSFDSTPGDRYPSRREALSAALAAASLALLGPQRAAAAQTHWIPGERLGAGPYLDAAREIARWLATVAIETPAGQTWPWAPATGTESQTSLYTGSPGVVLFHLELFAATGETRWRDQATAGADDLAATLPASAAAVNSAGLYSGLAGIAFTLAETARIAGTERHRAAAGRAIQLLHDSARDVGAGVAWNDVTDIVSGSAGTTLFLLWAAGNLDHPPSIELARRAGIHLLELALPTSAGSEWLMRPDFTRRMPNFSHGTAGVAYALARLHAATGEKAFLDGAMAGARHLLAIGDRTSDGFRIYHHDGDGEDLFYLSWCHGPAGTARLFHQLARETGDASWDAWVRRCATATQTSGIPEQRTPGFWNNISQCCGNAGVSDFFLDLHRIHGRDEDAAFARRSTADLLARATRGPDGMHWVQAEHRVQPDLLLAQTGLMQGAAGAGLLLLHHEAAERGARPAIVLPDSPFGPG
jgi:lantibiotic modifying enzyme